MSNPSVIENDIDPTAALEIIEKFKNRKGPLMPVLQEVQNHYGFVPPELIDTIAEGLNVYPSQIFGVLTFYSMFYMKKRGRHIIRVCRGTACHVKGSLAIFDEIRRTLSINDGESTIDFMFTLESVSCIGACGMAPVITVGGKTLGMLTTKKAMESIVQVKEKDLAAGK
ncbi:NAD(P)H-dependent oxidoreductase subunit E [Candidatus Poribacteria bacterium]|nr:NAD(P)H-dependent oxidoreductase subunit E [Candidatus Poribacteria bacterium]